MKTARHLKSFPTEDRNRWQHSQTLANTVEQHDLHEKSGWYTIGIGTVLILALVLRLYGVTWGYPYTLHVDENHTVHLGEGLLRSFLTEGSLDPKDSSYGGLPLYLLAFCAAIVDRMQVWFGVLLPTVSNFTLTVYLGRLLSVFESVVTVWLTAELGRRLFGKVVGLLSAVLLAVSLLSVRDAHFATVDTLLVALIALALLLGEWVANRGAWRDYLTMGVAIALAAATKTVALLLVVPFLVAHWSSQWQVRQGQDESDKTRHMSTRLRTVFLGGGLARLITTGVVIVALWLALNPYALLNPTGYFNLENNMSVLSQWLVVHGHRPVLYTLQFADTKPYLYVITNWLYWGMGLPLELLVLTGVGYSLWRLLCFSRPMSLGGATGANGRRATYFGDVYLLSWVLIYFVTIGGWYAKFIRYALPLMPFLCLLAGRFLAVLWRRDEWAMRGLSVVLTVGIVGASLTYTLAYLQIYRQPDVRLMAAAWLRQHVPVGSSILVERDEGLFFHRNLYGLKGYTWQIWNPYEVDGIRTRRNEAPTVSDTQTRAYLDRLLVTDYVVVSTYWYERFRAAAARFPAQADFSRRLFNGQARYRQIRVFQVYPQLGPFIWRDDTAELTFRLFDHPAVYVFARGSSNEQLVRDRKEDYSSQ